jgi:hypothetical protein
MCAAAAQRRTARSRCDRARERVAAPRERRSPRRSRVSSSVLGMMRVLLAAWITASRHTVARKIPESPSVATACSASAHSALMSPSPTLHTRPALLLSADPLTDAVSVRVGEGGPGRRENRAHLACLAAELWQLECRAHLIRRLAVLPPLSVLLRLPIDVRGGQAQVRRGVCQQARRQCGGERASSSGGSLIFAQA